MEIKDKNNKILAIIIKGQTIPKGKNFLTENEAEFQLASFNLDSGTQIKRHIHPNQKRNINTTTETLVVIEGKMKVDIYDESLDFIESDILEAGDTVSLIRGGHGLEVINSCKFVEIKQGPYIEEIDKKTF